MNSVCQQHDDTYANKDYLACRVAVKKPLLRRQNRIKRLRFAKQHKDWTKDDWNKGLLTDESKFELFGTNRRVYVRRRKGERFIDDCISPTVMHGGGNSMVWGSISGTGLGSLVKIDGIMDKKVYHNILVRHAVPSGRRLIGNNFVFQEDNDPKHSSNYCMPKLFKAKRSCRYFKSYELASTKPRPESYRANLGASRA